MALCLFACIVFVFTSEVNSEQYLTNLSLLRQRRNFVEKITEIPQINVTAKDVTPSALSSAKPTKDTEIKQLIEENVTVLTTSKQDSSEWSTAITQTTPELKTIGMTSIVTDVTTILDITQEDTGTTEEPRDNHHIHDFYFGKREKPQIKITSNISQVSVFVIFFDT